MKSIEVRQKFIDYFKKNGHSLVPSSRLIPEDDPTLLFANAGMNQFKNTFLGLEKRSYNRAVSSQKCVRAGGKHNDLENVGQTARHHTFFEMLGNFSFGDYFKKEAIHFAWEFITKELGLDKNRLYVSVFQDDQEAEDIWIKQEGVPKERIYRFGEKDNFWRMGDVGPCGPCSEIFYDLGPEVGGDPKQNVMGGEGDRYIEFWNLVFMQFQENEKGEKNPLPNPSIDTGAGLERLSAILQGEISNYHTDLFLPLMAEASKISGIEYHKNLSQMSAKDQKLFNESNIALRVLADHARASAFLIADGVLPSNEGRGYVLRRIMRRGIRFGRKLSEQDSLLPAVVQKVIQSMGDVYPDLKAQKNLLVSTVQDEEERFLSTLDQGTRILNEALEKQSGSNKGLNGELVFKLYDTYGFPLDLTRLMANEKGFQIDEADFEKRMSAARAQAKASWKGKSLSSDQAHLVEWSQKQLKKQGPTQFEGYQGTNLSEAKLVGLSSGKEAVSKLATNQTGIFVFDKTPFYAEGGGQVGDTGVIRASQGLAEVLDTTKVSEVFIHHVRVLEGEFKEGDACSLQVHDSERRRTAANHSATHLLHSALRKVLGTHVTQAGSSVDAERLRFDFTHNKPLTASEAEKLEDLVNQQISQSLELNVRSLPPEKAIQEGALALFGEKYGDEVRVVKMGDFSMELCGGTHVTNTSMIRLFKIVSEAGVSSGVRRIEALTGDRAFDYLLKNAKENLEARELAGLSENWNQYLNSDHKSLLQWIEFQKNEIKNLQKQLQSARSETVDVDTILKGAKIFELSGSKGKVLFAELALDDRKVLNDLSDRLKDHIQSGVVVVLGEGSGSHPLIVSVSKSFVGPLNAGKILQELAQVMGGKGGGRPDFAQGAVPDRQKASSAKTRLFEILNAH